MNFKLRPAEKKDTDDILGLIGELAIYEKEPDAVKTTKEDILRDGFGDNPFFHCLLAESEHQIEGFALYFFTWSTWEGCPSLYLEDLYVKESARGGGLGVALFKELAKVAVKNNCKRFEWSVLDWNQPALDFYHKLGAKNKEGWLTYRLEGDKLTELGN